MKAILSSLAGASYDYLKYCPTKEQYKYCSLGVIVLISTIFSMLAFGYAIFTTFKPLLILDEIQKYNLILISFLLAIIWGIFIGFINRIMLLSTYNKITLTLRIVIAIFIGIIVSQPLEILIFSKEIDSHISKKAEEEKRIVIDDYNKKEKLFNEAKINKEKLKIIENEIKETKKEIEKLRKKLQEIEIKRAKELNGTGITKLPGEGAEYKRLTKRFDDTQRLLIKKENLYEELKKTKNNLTKNIKQVNYTIDEIKKERDITLKNIHYKYDLSFIEKLTIIHNIIKENNTLFFTYWLISFLFISIEIFAIILKTFLDKGMYDKFEEKEQETFNERYEAFKNNITYQETKIKQNITNNKNENEDEKTRNRGIRILFIMIFILILIIIAIYIEPKLLEKIKDNITTLVSIIGTFIFIRELLIRIA